MSSKQQTIGIDTSENEMIATELLKTGAPYQRGVNKRKINNIACSIRKIGFMQGQPIIVSQNLRVIDGQNRFEAAKLCGVKDIPANVVFCRTVKEEAKLFNLLNSAEVKTLVSGPDKWHGLFFAGDAYAELLYLLNEDVHSLMHDQIRLRGVSSKATFCLTTATTILNTFGLKTSKYSPHHATRKRKLNVAADSVLKNEVIEGCNEFVGWANQTWSDEKLMGFVFNHKCIAAFSEFFDILNGQFPFKDFSRSEVKQMKKVMGQFGFINGFMDLTRTFQVSMLVKHFNLRKRVNKLVYKV